MLRSLMFTFLVHSSLVGKRIVPDLLDQGVGVGRAVSKKFGYNSMDDNWDRLSV